MAFETGLEYYRQAMLTSHGMRHSDPTAIGLPYFRTPFRLILDDGRLALFYFGLNGFQDFRGERIYVQISSDWVNFGPPLLIYQMPDWTSGTKWINAGCALQAASGRVFVFFTYSQDPTANGSPNDATGSHTPVMIYTDNLDLSSGWSASRIDMSASLKHPADKFLVFGIGQGVRVRGGAHAGKLVMMSYFRQSFTGIPWHRCNYSSDDGATWQMGAQANIANSAYDNLNETSLCEIQSSGRLYVNCRVIGSAVRKHYVFSDPTAANLPVPSIMTKDGATAVEHSQSQGDCWCDPATGRLYVAVSSMTSVGFRSNLKCWRSTDAIASDNPTFPIGRTVDPHGRYNSLAGLSPGNLVLISETVVSAEDEALTVGAGVPIEFLKLTRFNDEWLSTSLATDPDIYEWQFNEKSSGAIPNIGTPIKDHGKFGMHAQGRGASGISWDANGIVSSGSGGGLMLQGAFGDNSEISGGGIDWRSDPWSMAGLFVFPNNLANGSYVVYSNRTANDQRGVTIILTVVSNVGTLSIRWNNTTGSDLVHTLTGVNVCDGNPWSIWTIRDTANGHVRLRASNGGAFQGSTATADTKGLIVGSGPTRLFSYAGGTSPVNAYCRFLRIYVGKAFTDGELFTLDSLAAAKKTETSLWGYRHTSPVLPTSFANARLALACTWDGGQDFRGDYWASQRTPAPPQFDGQGVMALVNRVDGKLFRSSSLTRCNNWAYDARCGWYLRFNFPGADGSVPFFLRRSADSDGSAQVDANYDAPLTGVFGFSAVLMFHSSTSVDGTIIATGHSGDWYWIFIRNQSNSQLRVLLRRSGANIIDQSFSSLVLNLNTPYYIGIDADGANNFEGNGASKLTAYIGQYTGTLTPPSSLTKQVSTNSLSLSGSGNSTNAVHLGARVSGTFGPHFGTKNLMMFNAPLGAAEHLAWAKLAVIDGVSLQAGDDGSGLAALQWAGLI